jgi:ABC-type branched-subunit amino acid transport system substrate-binding protein
LVGYQAIEYDGSNSASVIAAIKNSPANIVYFAGYGYLASNLLRQLRANDVKAIFVGGSSLYIDPEFKFIATDVANGLRVVGLPSLKDINPGYGC